MSISNSNLTEVYFYSNCLEIIFCSIFFPDQCRETYLSPYSNGFNRHCVQASWNHWPQLPHCSIFKFHLQSKKKKRKNTINTQTMTKCVLKLTGRIHNIVHKSWVPFYIYCNKTCISSTENHIDPDPLLKMIRTAGCWGGN